MGLKQLFEAEAAKHQRSDADFISKSVGAELTALVEEINQDKDVSAYLDVVLLNDTSCYGEQRPNSRGGTSASYGFKVVFTSKRDGAEMGSAVLLGACNFPASVQIASDKYDPPRYDLRQSSHRSLIISELAKQAAINKATRDNVSGYVAVIRNIGPSTVVLAG